MNTFIIAPSNSDLQHHGILGQKWGIRRYQNKDGSLTEAGKARYGLGKEEQRKNYNTAKKTLKSNYKLAFNPDREKFKINQQKIMNIARDNIKQDQSLKNNIKNVRNKDKLYQEYSRKHEAITDFTRSKEYNALKKEAYNETMEWFKKNEPEYLKEIIKNNHGKNTGLDAFHDFRKMYDGNRGELWSKYENKWKTTLTKENKNLIKEENRLFNEYLKSMDDISKKILGKYSDIKINKLDKYSRTYGQAFVDGIDWLALYKEVDK